MSLKDLCENLSEMCFQKRYLTYVVVCGIDSTMCMTSM